MSSALVLRAMDGCIFVRMAPLFLALFGTLWLGVTCSHYRLPISPTANNPWRCYQSTFKTLLTNKINLILTCNNAMRTGEGMRKKVSSRNSRTHPPLSPTPDTQVPLLNQTPLQLSALQNYQILLLILLSGLPIAGLENVFVFRSAFKSSVIS